MSDANKIPDALRLRLPGGYSLPPFGLHQILALATVAIALWALGLLWLGMQTARQWVGSWQSEIVFHLYLPQEKAAGLPALQHAVAALPGVAKVSAIDPQEASQRMQSWLGDSGLTQADLASRLPYTLEIAPATEAPELFAALGELAPKHGASINSDEESLANARNWLSELDWVALFVTLILLAATAMIVSNTLRMTVLSRADELALMRLLGAQEWFVRMPFLIEGVVIGGGGALAAWLLLWPIIFGAGHWLAAFSLTLDGLSLLPPLLLCGIIAGAFGAFIATLRTRDDPAEHG